MFLKNAAKQFWRMQRIRNISSIAKIEYKPIYEDNYEDVIRHLRDNFFADEPLNKAAELCARGAGHRDLENYSIITLDDKMSIMATDENDKVAGVSLNGTLLPTDVENLKKKLGDVDENFKKIYELIYILNSKENLFNKLQVDKAFDLRIISVDGTYRGRGIAKDLVKQSEDIARGKQFVLMKADASGLFSQKTLISSGFEVLAEQYYDKYVDDSGRIVLPVESPHTKLQLMYKRLQ